MFMFMSSGKIDFYFRVCMCVCVCSHWLYSGNEFVPVVKHVFFFVCMCGNCSALTGTSILLPCNKTVSVCTHTRTHPHTLKLANIHSNVDSHSYTMHAHIQVGQAISQDRHLRFVVAASCVCVVCVSASVYAFGSV